MSGSEPEILRLRDHVHELRGEVLAHGLLYSDLQRRLTLLEPKVELLEDEARVTKAIARQARSDRRLVLTVTQRLAGVLIFGATIADLAVRLAGI